MELLRRPFLLESGHEHRPELLRHRLVRVGWENGNIGVCETNYLNYKYYGDLKGPEWANRGKYFTPSRARYPQALRHFHVDKTRATRCNHPLFQSVEAMA
ncbi:MAG: hypothetical protein Fur0039_01720 [Rhodocyclaceae bacterium]